MTNNFTNENKVWYQFASNKACSRSPRKNFLRLQALFSLSPLLFFFITVGSSLTRAVKISIDYLYPGVLFLKLCNFCIGRGVIDSSRVETVWESSRRKYVRIVIRHSACAMESILHGAKQDKKRIYC